VAVGLTALVVVLLALAHRVTRRSPAVRGPGLRAELRLLRALPPAVVAAALPLGALQVAARVAVLPVLAAAVPGAPSVDVTAVGSFALLYGQLVSPSPSGAGVVEYLGLHGVAGQLGAAAPWVLLWWRVYSTFAGALAGGPFLARALSARLRRAREHE
jgi:uncharacterized membrane protein YbhN (UPF0104 family)